LAPPLCSRCRYYAFCLIPYVLEDIAKVLSLRATKSDSPEKCRQSELEEQLFKLVARHCVNYQEA